MKRTGQKNIERLRKREILRFRGRKIYTDGQRNKKKKKNHMQIKDSKKNREREKRERKREGKRKKTYITKTKISFIYILQKIIYIDIYDNKI